MSKLELFEPLCINKNKHWDENMALLKYYCCQVSMWHLRNSSFGAGIIVHCVKFLTCFWLCGVWSVAFHLTLNTAQSDPEGRARSNTWAPPDRQILFQKQNKRRKLEKTFLIKEKKFSIINKYRYHWWVSETSDWNIIIPNDVQVSV